MDESKREKHSLFRRFGFDEGSVPHEQSRWRIRLHNVHAVLVGRIFPGIRYCLAGAFVISLVAVVYALWYSSAVRTAGTSCDADFFDVFIDSLTIIENISFITGEGLPRFAESLAAVGVDIQLIEHVILSERIIGILLNALITTALVAIVLRPINPIWLSPRVVLDTSQPGRERLTFRYWIRYPEKKWMHNCTCMVRFQSDAADRSIDRATEIDSVHVEHHNERRGVCEVNIGFDDVELDRMGEAVGSTRKRALARMIVARYAEAGYTYRVRFGSYEEIVKLSKEMKRKYEDYQILFRVSGSTSGSRSVMLERKYSIDDVLIGFVFKTVEEVDRSGSYVGRGASRWSGRYRYNYGNVWRVERCNPTRRPMDIDICAVESAAEARECFELVQDSQGALFSDNERPVSSTAVIYLARDIFTDELAERIYSVMARVHESLSNKDTYVISPKKRIAEKLKTGMFALVACDQPKVSVLAESEDGTPIRIKNDAPDLTKIVGFATFEHPDDPSNNYGYDIGLSEHEVSQVLMVDSMAVLPEFRGQGLQRRFLAVGEEIGVQRGYRIFIATVDPRNSYSLLNFVRSGYKRVKIVSAYGGKPREILVKRFRDSFE